MNTAADALTDATMDQIVIREMRGQASLKEVALLHQDDMLVYWLQTLVALEHQSQAHTAADKQRLAARKRDGTAQPTRAYVEAKARFREREARRSGFRGIVQKKRDEVGRLIARRGMTPRTLGTCIDLLVQVEALLADGQVDGAHQLVQIVITRWEDEAQRARAMNAHQQAEGPLGRAS